MNAASWSCIRFMQPNHHLLWSLDLYEVNKWCAINTRRCQYTIYLYDFTVRNGQKRHLVGIWGSTVCDLTIGDLSHSHTTCFLAICLSEIGTFQAGSLKNSERPSPVLTCTALGKLTEMFQGGNRGPQKTTYKQHTGGYLIVGRNHTHQDSLFTNSSTFLTQLSKIDQPQDILT
jgi:hypothetical protein